jgi:hypothetical protein
MPTYMIDFTIGIAEPRKDELVKYIDTKLMGKGYPPLNIEKKTYEGGLIYWVMKTRRTIPRKTRDEIIKEIMSKLPAEKKIIDPRISITLL